jgi:hypothetical protein
MSCDGWGVGDHALTTQDLIVRVVRGGSREVPIQRDLLGEVLDINRSNHSMILKFQGFWLPVLLTHEQIHTLNKFTAP